MLFVKLTAKKCNVKIFQLIYYLEDEVKLMSNEKKDNKKEKINIKAVIILIISAIVFLPAGGYGLFSALAEKKQADSSKILFGKYNDKEIVWEYGSDFANYISYYYNLYSNFGYDVSSNQGGIRDYIFQQAYNEALKSIAYTDEVTKSNYTVPAKAVNRVLMNNYLDKNGNFDERAFNTATATEVDQQRKEIETSLIVNRYSDDVLGTSTMFYGESVYGIKTSAKEMEFIAAMGNEKHSFEVACFATTNFPVDEAVKYASENTSKFTKYDLSAVTVSTEDEAKSTLKQLTANEITFEDIVSVQSLNLYTDALGKVTSLYRYNIENEVLENAEDFAKISSLTKDSYSEIIKTKKPYSSETTYTIFRCDGNSTEADLTDTNTQNIVLEYLRNYEAGYIEDYYINVAKSFTADAKDNSFQIACNKYGIELTDVPAFPVNYNNSSFYQSTTAATGLTSVSKNENVLKALFTLKLNETSEPIVIGSNVVVAKCTGIQFDESESTENYPSTIVSNDSTAENSYLNSSKKHENNFWAAYIKNVGMPSSFN